MVVEVVCGSKEERLNKMGEEGVYIPPNSALAESSGLPKARKAANEELWMEMLTEGDEVVDSFRPTTTGRGGDRS